MKLRVILTLLLAVAISFSAVLIPQLPGAPDSQMALGGGGVWLTESYGGGYYLYRLSADGRIDSARWNPARGGREPVVAGLAAGEDFVYALSLLYPKGSAFPDRWEVWEYGVTGGSRFICSGVPSQLGGSMSLNFSGNMLYISGWRSNTGTAVVFAVDPSAETPEASEIESASMQEPIIMRYARGTIYCLSRDGQLSRYRQGAQAGAPEDVKASHISASGDVVCLYDSASGQTRVLGDGGYSDGLQLKEGSSAITGAADASGNEYCLAVGSGGSYYFACRNELGENEYRFMQTFSTVTAAAMRTLTSQAVIVPVITAVCVLLIFLLTRLARIMLKLAVLISISGILTSSIIALILTAYFYGQLSAAYREEAAFVNASDAAGFPIGFAGRISAHSLSDEDLNAMASVTGPRVISAGGRERPVFTDILQYDENGTPRILASGRAAFGAAAFSVYTGADTADGIPGSSGMLKERGRYYAASVAAEEAFILVTLLDASSMVLQTRDMFWSVMLISLGIFSALVIFIIISGTLMARPLKALREGMSRISDGDYTANIVTSANNEFGDMERSLQELSLSLSIREYETRTLINSFHRFVPSGIETLLTRASISEVVCGDNVELSGCLGIVSVSNRASAMEDMDNTRYMRFVSGCFGYLQENAAMTHGQFLSASFDMSGAPIYFDQNADEGVAFGLRLMSRETDNPEDDGCEPKFFLLLHQARALLGVAGNERRAFPFLSSPELSFLQSYSDALEELGCSIIVTESFMRRLTPGRFSSRYIGFISSPDEQYSCKLFEILDMYTDQERARCLQYDKKMQDAISLFYKNNFYLARNIFMSILKMRPDDGVARWYTFACENYFNSDDLSDTRYDLLGLKE